MPGARSTAYSQALPFLVWAPVILQYALFTKPSADTYPYVHMRLPNASKLTSSFSKTL